MKRISILVAAVVCAFMVFGCASQQKKPKAAKAAEGLQRIHFDFDRSFIKPEYEPVLKGNADWMRANGNTNVTIEGHCDERGSVEYNIALGDRRANSAKKYLTNLGIPTSRLSTISYGKERPLCTQHDESCWWQNRRDEFVAR
ncbi:MAG: peptidoglycan-associated lipoprotein Pal [Pseudomonadota bacterium]